MIAGLTDGVVFIVKGTGARARAACSKNALDAYVYGDAYVCGGASEGSQRVSTRLDAFGRVWTRIDAFGTRNDAFGRVQSAGRK